MSRSATAAEPPQVPMLGGTLRPRIAESAFAAAPFCRLTWILFWVTTNWNPGDLTSRASRASGRCDESGKGAIYAWFRTSYRRCASSLMPQPCTTTWDTRFRKCPKVRAAPSPDTAKRCVWIRNSRTRTATWVWPSRRRPEIAPWPSPSLAPSGGSDRAPLSPRSTRCHRKQARNESIVYIFSGTCCDPDAACRSWHRADALHTTPGCTRGFSGGAGEVRCCHLYRFRRLARRRARRGGLERRHWAGDGNRTRARP